MGGRGGINCLNLNLLVVKILNRSFFIFFFFIYGSVWTGRGFFISVLFILFSLCLSGIAVYCALLVFSFRVELDKLSESQFV